MTANAAEMLRALYRAAPVAVVMIDADGRIDSVNPSAARLFGRDADTLTGQRGDVLFAVPREFDALAASAFGLDDARPTRDITLRYRSHGGRVLDGETVATRIAGEDGAVLGTLLMIRDVSAERGLQARLEASDIQLRAALASANEGAFSLNLKTGLGSARGFINEFLGIASADATIRRERLLEVADPEMREQLDAAIGTLVRTPTETLDIVYRAKRADGETRWLEMRGKVSEFARDGTPLRLSGTISDVTDRQRLEERLAERERQLANAIEAGSCGVWEFDPSRSQLTLLGPIRAMLDLEDDETSSVDLEQMIQRLDPDTVETGRARITSLTEGKSEIFDIEFPLQDARNGETRWLKAHGRLTAQGPSGPIAAGILTDISERRLLEAKVEAGEQLLREAIESANDGVWSLRTDTRRVRFSGFIVPQFGLGVSEAEISFEEWLNHAPQADRPRVRESLEKLSSATRDSGPAILDALFGEFPMTGSDGSILWLRTRGRIVEWSEDGHPLRLSGTISNVTEEHRLRTALNDSRTMLNDALEAAGEGAWRLDLPTQIVEITASIAEMMGLPPADARITYSDWLERVHPDDLPTCSQCIQQLVAGESDTVNYRIRFLSEKDGWINIHNRGEVRERSPEGEPLIATGFITDISQRIETEQRLKQREQQLAKAVDAAAVGLWRRDYRDDTVTFRGSLVAELFNRAGEISLTIDDWHERVHPDDLADLKNMTAEVIAHQQTSADYVYRLKDHKGDWVWYRNSGSVVEWDAAGRPLVSSGVIWNIDAAQKAEAELDERRARFEHIYRASPAMMHTIDADGYIVEVSDYWLTHLGYQREEVVGRRSTDFLDAESRERALSTHLPHLFETGTNTNVPYRFVHRNGRVIDVLLSSFLERDREGRPLLSYAVMTDVTPLREANEKLERSNRELDRFATVASHDLQEPLRKIASFSSLLRRRYADALDDDGRRNLDFLVDAAHRMQRLIDDLLTYSRLASQPIRREPVAIADAVARALDHLDSAITESGARIEVGDMPTVQGDAVLLTQIFQNLVGNALKYRSFATPEVDIAARREDGRWVVTVSDNGIGFDVKFAEKIFAPFQRLHPHGAYPGTGIGLAIVRQSIERLGGEIWVESEPGSGATFSFTLPADDTGGSGSGTAV